MLNDNSTKDIAILSDKKITRMEKILSFEWLGQTFASLFWIVSVFTYGIGSTGDWLQLFAASSWMVSNIATIISIKV
mgnify:FL=1|tara:strand:+ start:5081 stop:5311 length:231 start_codon:yes stop_codon:yes gene_type:complete